MNKVLRYLYNKKITRMNMLMYVAATILCAEGKAFIGAILYAVSIIVEVNILSNKKFMLSQLSAIEYEMKSWKEDGCNIRTVPPSKMPAPKAPPRQY